MRLYHACYVIHQTYAKKKSKSAKSDDQTEKKSSKSRKLDDQTEKKSAKSGKSDDATHESDDCTTKGFPSSKFVKINAPWSPFVVVTDTIDLSGEKSAKSDSV